MYSVLVLLIRFGPSGQLLAFIWIASHLAIPYSRALGCRVFWHLECCSVSRDIDGNTNIGLAVHSVQVSHNN